MKYIRTSIKEHSEHTLKKAYEGQTFFWGVRPKESDTIEFWFAKPTIVTRSLLHQHLIKKYILFCGKSY